MNLFDKFYLKRHQYIVPMGDIFFSKMQVKLNIFIDLEYRPLGVSIGKLNHTYTVIQLPKKRPVTDKDFDFIFWDQKMVLGKKRYTIIMWDNKKDILTWFNSDTNIEGISNWELALRYWNLHFKKGDNALIDRREIYELNRKLYEKL